MKKVILATVLASTLSIPAFAQDLSITVTNLTHGSSFTPLLIAAHNSSTHLFQAGSVASSSLQAMAEGGDISGLESNLDAAGADKVSNPAGGILLPAMSTTTTLTTNDGNDHLSIVAMVLPTNDGFMGLNSIAIPTAAGTYTYDIDAYDAGTEANDEIINGGGAPGTPGIPADPTAMNGENGTGVTSSENNTNIHIHRGVLGDTDAMGGTSDLDSRIHRWLNPVARVVITVQ